VELDFKARANLCKNSVGKKLFEIMHCKKTNLCVAADCTSFDQVLKLADLLGPHICLFKTHVDIITDFTEEKIRQLVDLAAKHNFLIFEDRKFADIGNTVKHQFADGIYKISQWADLVNAHTLPGPGCVQGLKEAGQDKACLLIAQMSSSGTLVLVALGHIVLGFLARESGDELLREGDFHGVVVFDWDVDVVGR